MAKPIKETPVLTGADARRFREKMDSASKNKVDAQTKERMKSNFDKLNKVAQF